MKCVFCGHDLKEIKKDIEQNLNGKHIIIKEVPVYYCENCAEEYYDDCVLDEIEKIVKSQKAIGEKLLPIYKFKEEAALIAR